MIRVEARGLQEAVKSLETIMGSLQDAKVELEMSRRSREILIAQANMGRNVVKLTRRDTADLKAELVNEFSGHWYAPTTSGEEVWRNVWRAAGEWFRQCIADKIEDKRAVIKAPLTPAYAREKMREWGKTHPILVASGEMLDDVREAGVRVSKR